MFYVTHCNSFVTQLYPIVPFFFVYEQYGHFLCNLYPFSEKEKSIENFFLGFAIFFFVASL